MSLPRHDITTNNWADLRAGAGTPAARMEADDVLPEEAAAYLRDVETKET